MSHSNQHGRARRWPHLGECVLLAGRHPFAGQHATVLRFEKPWGLKLFGAFPRVRTEGGREEYLYLYTEWLTPGEDAERQRRRRESQAASQQRYRAKQAAR